MPGLFNVAVEAIIEKGSLILITKRADHRDHQPGQWETLTGRVEHGESFEQALIREVREEVELEVEVVQPFNTFHFFRGSEQAEHLGVTFLCRYKSGEVQLNTDEQSDYKWVTPQQALELIQDKSIRNSIEHYKRLKR